VRIVTNCDALHRRLRDLKIVAEQDTAFSGDISIEVLKRDGRYVIVEMGETLICSADPEWVTLYVNELVNFRLAHHMRDFLKIHAACGSLNGRRFLLAGKKGAGKTTLITRLLFDGVSGHGDEKILVRGNEVIPLSGKFHLKDGTVLLIPQLGTIWKNLTSYPGYGVRTCFFSPLDAGFDWQIRWGHADVIFYLSPNHGRETWTERCPKWEMAQHLILRSSDFDANPEGQIADLCGLTKRSDTFIIHIGELNGAVRAIREILS